MSTLRGTIEGLASQFASSVIEALRGASIDELLDVAQGSGGAGGGTAPVRRPPGRRSQRRGPRGRAPCWPWAWRPSRPPLRDRHCGRDQLDRQPSPAEPSAASAPSRSARRSALEAKELPVPRRGHVAGSISKEGQKRATTYFAGWRRRPQASRWRGRRPASRPQARLSSKRASVRGGLLRRVLFAKRLDALAAARMRPGLRSRRPGRDHSLIGFARKRGVALGLVRVAEVPPRAQDEHRFVRARIGHPQKMGKSPRRSAIVPRARRPFPIVKSSWAPRRAEGSGALFGIWAMASTASSGVWKSRPRRSSRCSRPREYFRDRHRGVVYARVRSSVRDVRWAPLS